MPPDTPPRWTPQTEADIEQARTANLLEETHFLDFKAEVKPGGGGNNELARDLAQFAIDSGALLIGVAEDDNKKFVLAPIDLAGLPERVEQVAQSIDPPLYVTTRVINSETDAGKGYLWVDVPASSTAPHQAGGIYYGRGDKTRIRLSDVEVRRIHAQQAAAERAALDDIRTYVDHDPVPADDRKQAHLYVVAVPATPRPEMLLDAVDGPQRYETLHGILSSGARAANSAHTFSPSLYQVSEFARRADGAAMTMGSVGQDRSVDMTGRDAESFLEAAISESGTVRVMTGRFSTALRDDPDQQVLFETMLPVLVRQTVDIAGKVAEHAGYGGQWHFAVYANGIAGLPAHLSGQGFHRGNVQVAVDTEVYENSTSASTAEVLGEPWAVARRLAGRFVRSLGISDLRAVSDVLGPPTEG